MMFEIWIREKLYGVKWLNLGDELLVTQFVSHVFGHAFFTFWLLEIPWGFTFAWLVAGYAFYKEAVLDGHWGKLWSDLDARTDLISRMFGSLVPYLTLVWRF